MPKPIRASSRTVRPGPAPSATCAAQLFKQLTGLPDIVHVPYKGGNNALADLYGGQIPMVATSVSQQTVEAEKAGKLRMLVAAGTRRLTGAPNVPIGAEVGYPDLVAEMFMGAFAPAKTPRGIIEQISDASKKVMADQDFQRRLIENGFEPIPNSDPDQAAAYLKREIARWRPILEAAGIQELARAFRRPLNALISDLGPAANPCRLKVAAQRAPSTRYGRLASQDDGQRLACVTKSGAPTPTTASINLSPRRHRPPR